LTHFLYKYEYGIFKPLEIIIERDWGMKENSGEDELIWGIIQVYMELSQQNPSYNYHKLTKMSFLKK
jgi:hypothetical protein